MTKAGKQTARPVFFALAEMCCLLVSVRFRRFPSPVACHSALSPPLTSSSTINRPVPSIDSKNPGESSPNSTMVATKSTSQYPRNVLRRIVKAHSGCNISKNADILIYLDYALFLEQLLKEAGINAKASGEKQITPRSIKKAKDTVLKKFRA